MCDCEELEFEDFELMLTTLSKKAAAEAPGASLQAPVPIVPQKRNR